MSTGLEAGETAQMIGNLDELGLTSTHGLEGRILSPFDARDPDLVPVTDSVRLLLRHIAEQDRHRSIDLED